MILICHRVEESIAGISVVRSKKIESSGDFIFKRKRQGMFREMRRRRQVLEEKGAIAILEKRESDVLALRNPIKSITKKEWGILICSMLIIGISNLVTGNVNMLMLLAAWIGVISLILAAKGNVWAQILMVVFSVLYAVISWTFRYWGEMITYLGMTLPMAVCSTITWLKNPSENGKEVAIQALTRKHMIVLLSFGSVVAAFFYYILQALDTPNIVLSTVSIETSFLAAALTLLRSSYYALGYAANDLVLIVLWILASFKNPEYIPVVINFAIFLFNDMYGFLCWRKRELSVK